MKEKLTAKQSNRLFELGVKTNFASGIEMVEKCDAGCRTVPVFTLADLFDLLPKEIKVEVLDVGYEIKVTAYLHISLYNGNSLASYHFVFDEKEWSTHHVEGSELVDTLYELVIWCIESGHLKTQQI